MTPKPAEGKHSDFLSGADLFVNELPGIQSVYVVPYEYCRHSHKLIIGYGGCEE